jgi:ABC-type transporter Mla maintaining outer membrane lipid asymmetry ATPase subunit MlaF
MTTTGQLVMERGVPGKAAGAPAAPAIAVEALHKSFGSQKILNGISLTVSCGETLAVLGRSGAGKSVLL